MAIVNPNVDDIESPELEKLGVEKQSAKLCLPVDKYGKVSDGTYYYLGNIENYDQCLLFVAVVKDNFVKFATALNAQAVFTYLSLNSRQFMKKAPEGVV